MRGSRGVMVGLLVLSGGSGVVACRDIVGFGPLIPPDAGGGRHLSDAGEDAPKQGGATPATCAQAASWKSHVGCDFWPTVTANLVEDIFDFTVIVVNPQATTANLTITGPGGFTTTGAVASNSSTNVYLPWVAALKGPAYTASVATFVNSVSVAGGAYHIVSSVPVSAYQFNALEYQGTGGPPGKSWVTCVSDSPMGACFSYSNDASLLLPSTAWTGNYRATGEHGSTLLTSGGFMAITAAQDGTSVEVTVSPTGSVVASATGDIPATAANAQLTLSMNAGDVVELMGVAQDAVDLSGSFVAATNPVQLIVGRQCANQPDPVAACDHLESSVFPAETLGKDYVVTVPTSPHATVVGHVVRFFGNVDGTQLTYSPSAPPGCPTVLNAAQVVECAGTANCATGINNFDGGAISVSCVTDSFEVMGTHGFAVSSFMLAGSAVDHADSPMTRLGDPSMSPVVPTEQYRSQYLFVAPTDYTESYADLVLPTGATATLDGNPMSSGLTPLNDRWGILRLTLGAGQGGVHLISASKPFGMQVIGYGSFTSYQYPAGLNLSQSSVP